LENLVSQKVVAVVQVRTNSSRFPGKVLRKIRGTSIVELISRRLGKAREVDEIVFGTSSHSTDDELASEIIGFGGKVFRGSLDDVQERFIQAAEHAGANLVVRITGDCPLIDWEIVDHVIRLAKNTGAEYSSNTHPPTFPDGLDVEVFSLDSLKASRQESADLSSKEHVTTNLRISESFSRKNLDNEIDYSELRWTVDYPADLRYLESNLPNGFETMTWKEIMTQGFDGIDSSAKRNEGGRLGSGQKLWKRAQEVIPGGGMLLSKRSEMFLPDEWPAYYSRAKGIKVWDLDGKEYLDFANMSVGACSLGYGVETIDNAVKQAIDEGVMSSLNSPSEVFLAEKLIEMHPWSDMARFARSGGEANAIAIRIARAHTGKDKIAICGYHGWHDWYLSANLSSDSNLDGHLLPGLSPSGVPRGLAGTTVPFSYNNATELAELLKTGEFAAVKMEVSRNFGPEDGFLQEVRDLCTHYGAVLIFDECTSGFRETFGGLHLKYGVNPDLAMFGKALGNGYAITAVIGRREVMQAAQGTFISSTFWTERLGPVAALATLNEMEKVKSWEKISATGKKVKGIWDKVFSKLQLRYQITGLDALANFTVDVPDWLGFKTLMTQEMLDRGYLSSSYFYASTQHDPEHLSKYAEDFEASAVVSAGHSSSETITSALRVPRSHNSFRRLN
jgi:glutamate-1-semialdehyde 2,1-aminomutase